MTSKIKFSSPSLDRTLKEATKQWKDDLENLLYDAKSRFADVVWEVLDDPDERIGGVWGAKTLGRKRPRDLRSLLGFARDSNTNITERYREVWGHKAMIYSRASPGFHLRHFSQTLGAPTQSEPNSPLSTKSISPSLEVFNKEEITATHVRHTTPSRYTVFVQELLDIYTGKGGLGDFESLRLDYDADEEDEDDWRTRKLRQDLLTMWKTRLYSDTRISIVYKRPFPPSDEEEDGDGTEITETAVFHAHSFILVSRSPYFASILPTIRNVRQTLSLVLTLPWPLFSPTSLKWILEYIYTGTLPLPFPDTSANLTSAFAIWRGAQFLGIKTLPKLMANQITNLLHGLCFSVLDNVQYKKAIGESWTRMVSSGGCQCETCRRRLPRVLAFSMASETKNNILERGALRGLIKIFGLGWCTPQFAALSQELKNYVLLVFKFTVLIPPNALSLLFAAGEALEELDGSSAPIPSWLEPIKVMIISVRDSIDAILCEETSECLESDGWETIRKNDVLEVDLGLRSTGNPRKLAAIGKAILRGVGPGGAVKVYRSINAYTKEAAATSWRGVHTPTNSVLQAHLHHLKTELRNMMDIVPEDLDDVPHSDSIRSSIHTLSTASSTSLMIRPTSSICSSAHSTSSGFIRPMSAAEMEDTARQSSIDALDLASISNYSHASSRTESTDYGLFYTRRAYSEESINTVTMLRSHGSRRSYSWRGSMGSVSLGIQGENEGGQVFL